jgi:cobalt-zinc-cadmium efflux system membrane fusion protein
MTRLLWLCGALALLACEHDHAPAGHGHAHGPHGEHLDPADAAPETLAITRWTDAYELFIELPTPAPGKPVPLHAHVTRLADFAAVTEGTFRVRFTTPAGVAAEATQPGVKRPGVFVFEAIAPEAGTYGLELSYTHEGHVSTFDGGLIAVTDDPAHAPEEEGGTVTFLKESQWKIPFGTVWAEERPLARELELAATVEAAGGDQLTVGAPTGGRFFHDAALGLSEGLSVTQGQVLGTLAPAVAGEDFSRLELAVAESTLARAQAQRELDRVSALVTQGLLPQRRVVELRDTVETHAARLRAAEARLAGVLSPGRGGAVVLRAPKSGVIAQVLVSNGAPVEAGAPLVRLGGTGHPWIRARFVAKPAHLLAGAQPAGVRLPSGPRVELEAARFLSALPTVDPASRVATWIVDAGPVRSATTAQELRPGTSVVLLLRVGEPRVLLAVPRTAVVELNTRPYVFVQVEGERFEKRAVTLGQSDGPWVHVISGLRAGERVVSRGGFDIHLASLMGTVESHRH